MNKLQRLKHIQNNEGLLGVIKAINRYRYHNVGNLSHPVSRRLFEPKLSPVNQLEYDYDYLIILDACRYDLYREVVGNVESVDSSGSSTREWLQRNVKHHYDNLVYVTANPMYRKIQLEGGFHTIVAVWESDWNTEYETVLPEPMTQAVLRASREYPEKQIVAHYVQPHYPFLSMPPNQKGFNKLRQQTNGVLVSDPEMDVWIRVANGELSRKEAWDYYRDNLKRVLLHVQTLIDELEGKFVITSDHGNMIGERIVPFIGKKYYGHPNGIVHPKLREVPFHVIDKRPSNTVADKLEALGYKDE